jgi:hypothetical protein
VSAEPRARGVKEPPRCPKCRAFLDAPAPHPDGLPGILYRTCAGCGYSAAVTVRARRVKLDD